MPVQQAVVPIGQKVGNASYLFGKDGVAITGGTSGKYITFKGKRYWVYASGRAVLA